MLNDGTFYGYYEISDGRYMTVGSIDPKFRQQLCMAVGREDVLALAMRFLECQSNKDRGWGSVRCIYCREKNRISDCF